MLHLPVNVAGTKRRYGYQPLSTNRLYKRRESSYVSATGAGRGGYIALVGVQVEASRESESEKNILTSSTATSKSLNLVELYLSSERPFGF